MQRSDSNQFVPQGRPAGSRNKRTKELLARLEARGDLDPADFLSALITDEKEPKELRVQASNVLLPYIHPKWQSTPVPRYLEDDINIPKEFTCVEDAEKFLAHITARVTAKTLDLDFAEALSKMAIGWIQSQYAKQGLDLKSAAQGDTNHDTRIIIEGGLPPLPLGPNDGPLLMPTHEQMNGHNYELPPPPASFNPSSLDGVHEADPTGAHWCAPATEPTESISTCANAQVEPPAQDPTDPDGMIVP